MEGLIDDAAHGIAEDLAHGGIEDAAHDVGALAGDGPPFNAGPPPEMPRPEPPPTKMEKPEPKIEPEAKQPATVVKTGTTAAGAIGTVALAGAGLIAVETQGKHLIDTGAHVITHGVDQTKDLAQSVLTNPKSLLLVGGVIVFWFVLRRQ